MKKKWIVYLAVLVALMLALPLSAGAVPENYVTGVTITSAHTDSTEGACSESSGTWSPLTKLDADSTFTLTVSVTFLNPDDGAKAVYYDNRTMTLSEGKYTIGELTQSDITSRKPITVYSGDSSYTTYVRAYIKSSDTGVTRVTFTLDPDDGTADQTVNLTNLSSIANLPNKDGTVSVSVTPSNSGASVSFIAPFSNPALTTPATTRDVSFTVTAEDGSTRNYVVTCQRQATLATDANLSNLLIKKTGGTNLLNQSSPSTSTYTITNAGSSIDVTPTLSDTNATYVIKKNGTTIATNAAATSVSISSSSYTTITVVVTAQNGTTTKTYTARVYYATAGSSNADLDGLKVSTKSGSTSSSYLVDLYPDFDADTTSYTMYVPNDISKVYVYPTTEDSDADFTINDGTSSTVTLGTSTSGTSVDIDVEAEDGTTKTYSLKIYRAASSASDDAELDSLELRTSSSASSAIDLNPKFDADEDEYTANVDEDQSSVRVYAEASSSKAIVLVNGEKLTSDYKQISSLSKTKTNKIEITVIAADYETTKTYTVTVTRGDSSNNYLSGISVKTIAGTTVTISPTFKSSTTSYTATVANTVTEIAIKATAQDKNSSIKIDGDATDSGDWSDYITLSVGSNSILIAVTADDGSKKTYYLTVTRAAGTTAAKTIKLTIGGASAVVNGSITTLDAAPFLYTYKNAGYTLVPIRFVSEQLGAKVDWNATTKVVTITQGTKTLTMKLGVANSAVGLDVPPMARNGRTFVPLRYVSEQLGAKVDWNSTTKAITITMN